jgi:hypothetical protein
MVVQGKARDKTKEKERTPAKAKTYLLLKFSPKKQIENLAKKCILNIHMKKDFNDHVIYIICIYK